MLRTLTVVLVICYANNVTLHGIGPEALYLKANAKAFA